MTLPLATPFPLKGTPFYSRISDQLTSDPVINYYAIAFNPGYPLQASELNEFQELFFLNSFDKSAINNFRIGRSIFNLPFVNFNISRR